MATGGAVPERFTGAASKTLDPRKRSERLNPDLETPARPTLQ
jgi:hypothetical protein